MTRAAEATANQVTVAHYAVNGGELAVSYRPGFRPVYRLNGMRVSAADAQRKLH
jgi:hypothetical protein